MIGFCALLILLNCINKNFVQPKAAYLDKKLQSWEIGRVAKEEKQVYRHENLSRNENVNAQLSAIKKETRGQKPVTSSKHMLEEFPLGVAFGFLYRGEIFMPYIKELGINLTKLYIYWQQIEPQRGKYAWSVVDKFLNQLDQDSEVLISLWSTSEWGTKEKPFKGGSRPLKMDYYYKFVFNMVKHCQGKIRYWQNDCEPNANFWKGSAEEFVSTLKVFYKAVKDADPKAKVLVGGHNGFFTPEGPSNQCFFDHIFKEAKDHFDILDLRLYGDIYSIADRIEWFRRRMGDFGFQKPMFCTEYGGPWPAICPDYKQLRKEFMKLKNKQGKKVAMQMMVNRIKKDRDKLSPCLQMFSEDCSKDLGDKRHRMHCRDIVARTIIALSCGIKKLWYWDMFNKPHIVFGKFRLMDEKSKERYPAFYAYQRMVKKLRGISSITHLRTKSKNLYLFVIEKGDGKRLYVLWEKRDPSQGEGQPPTSFKLDIEAKKVTLTDVFGREEVKDVQEGILKINVTDTPLYLEIIN